MFGIGTELREGEWRGVVRQLLAQGLLAVEGDYGTLVLTEASGEVLSGQRQVLLRREPERAGQRRAPLTRRPSRPQRARRAARGAACQCSNCSARWRAATAKEQGVPAYVIFHDATLRQIATEAPSTLAELGTVNGVGETKLARYGQQILDTLTGAVPAIASTSPDGT